METAAYEGYARELDVLVRGVCKEPWGRTAGAVTAALDGQASIRLRELVPRQVRRDYGAFFTSGAAREAFARVLEEGRASSAQWWDPTCGAGDLLLAVTGQLPIEETSEATITAWSQLLRGTDLHQSFVSVARARLVLAVLQRHALRGDSLELPDHVLERAFSNLVVGDGLQELRTRLDFDGHIVLNPPFASVPVGRSCSWSTGQTSAAAVFAHEAAHSLGPTGRLTAILPDVLRSGSRYGAWREVMRDTLRLTRIERFGQFDAHADVDVFMLAAEAYAFGGTGQEPTWWPMGQGADTVATRFAVSVGSVVDNRDPHEGPESVFLTARDLPSDGQMPLPARRRRFAGRRIEPPFIVLRRTSRPGQGSGGRNRGVGVMVIGAAPVAVDNHLIVVKPLAGGVEACEELLERLSRPDLAQWLDERISCRHLTVRVVRDIPWT